MEASFGPKVRQLIWDKLVSLGWYDGNPAAPAGSRYSYSEVMGMNDGHIPTFLNSLGLQAEANEIMPGSTQFMDLPPEVQVNILGRVSPTAAKEFVPVSKAWSELADYALVQNINQGRIVDPTIGIPDRAMYFKLSDETQGEYFDPTPGLSGNIKSLRSDRTTRNQLVGLVYGTFRKSDTTYISTDDEYEKLQALKTIPGTDYVKFVSLVTYVDYDRASRAYNRKLERVQDIIQQIDDKSELPPEEKEYVLEELREELRYLQVLVLGTVVLTSHFSEQLKEAFQKYRTEHQTVHTAPPVPISSDFSTFGEVPSHERLEILKSWKYPESGIVDLSQDINALALIFSKPHDRASWDSASLDVFPDYNYDSIFLNNRHIDFQNTHTPGWNIKMIPIPHHYIRDSGLIIPSLQDDVYVV